MARRYSPDGDWITLVGENLASTSTRFTPTPWQAETLPHWGRSSALWIQAFGSADGSARKKAYCVTSIASIHGRRSISILRCDSTRQPGAPLFRLGKRFYDEDNAQFVRLYSDDYSASMSGSRSAEHRPCTLRIYDADGLHEFELDYECRIFRPCLLPEEQVFRRVDNMLYFFTIASEEAAITELRSYDLNLPPEDPRQTAVLAVGEIEAIQELLRISGTSCSSPIAMGSSIQIPGCATSMTAGRSRSWIELNNTARSDTCRSR